MYSKWKVWDFFKSKKNSIAFDEFGIHAFSSFDPLISSFIKDSLPTLDDKEKFRVVMGSEVTLEWFEDNFRSLGLFGNTTSYFIHFAQDIKKEIIDLIIQGDLLLDNRFLVLSFNKPNDSFKALTKIDSINTVEITEPMFWEHRELLEFLSSHISVYLDYDASAYLIDTVEPNCQEYFRYLNQLSLLHGKQKISKASVKDVVGGSRLDQFKLADLFGSKKFTLFYEELNKLDIDTNAMRVFFIFMQKHMGKISDLRFLDKKKKLSKYDRQLIAHNKLWNEGSIDRSISYFKNLEHNLKLGAIVFKHLIKRDYYRSF